MNHNMHDDTHRNCYGNTQYLENTVHINKVILFKQKNKCSSPRSSFYLFLQSKKINGKKKAIKKDKSKTTTL